jgi:hypothetical protein
VHQIAKLQGIKHPDFTPEGQHESARDIPASMRSYLSPDRLGLEHIERSAIKRQQTLMERMSRRSSHEGSQESIENLSSPDMMTGRVDGSVIKPSLCKSRND